MGKRKPPKRPKSAPGQRAVRPAKPFRPEDEAGTPYVSAEEAAATFEHKVTLETFMALKGEVLRRWRNTCAITGQTFSDEDARATLQMIAIRPTSAGGPIHASNILPLTEAAARAFETQRVIVGDDFEIWAGLSWIASEVVGRFVPLGKLKVPEDEAFWPDRAQLRWHREQALDPYPNPLEPHEPTS